MHPKLRDPDETLFEDTIFPRLELIEPDISQMERTLVLNASATMKYFPTAQVKVTNLENVFSYKLHAYVSTLIK